MEFEEVILKEIATIQTGPFGSQLHKSDYIENGTPIITVEHLGENRILHNNLPGVKKEDVKRLSKYNLLENDIVFSRVGSVDRRAIVSNKEEGWLFSGRCLRVRVTSDKVNPIYLSYYFGLPSFKEYIRNIAVGATMPSINTKILSNIKVKIPSIEEQTKIVNILHSLDSKIWINEEIISNLENLIQAFFKNWFLDFKFPNELNEPYKLSGGEFEEINKDLEVPIGWKTGTLSEVIQETLSGDWGKEQPEKNHQSFVNIIRGADIPELRSGRRGKVPKRYILEKNFNSKKLLEGDVVVEVSGGSPSQSTGRSIYINTSLLSEYDNRLVSTNFCRVIRPVNKYQGFFIQNLLLNLYNKNVFFQLENGTTGIKNLDINNLLEKYKVVLPPFEVVKKFYTLTSSYNNLIQEKGRENRKLENTRDLLLKNLLSGSFK